ncbi:MAG: sugar ABC transporter permease [Firmicutes bacterium]|nr:sugar ABC transporter permease [Bacillota bacterium]
MIVSTRKEKAGYYLFLAPAYIIFAVFIFWPVIHSLYLSFFKYNMMTIKVAQFNGIQNYLSLLHDKVFTVSVVNTVYFVIGTIPFEMVLGLLIALIINSSFVRLKTVYKVGFYIPYVSSMVAVSIIWTIIFNPTPNGLINTLLIKAGMQPLGWISDSKLALPTVMLLVIWKEIGYIMIIYLSGLASIPGEIYEAAALDPISTFKKLIYITLPLLKPTIIFLLITQVIASFQVFTPVNVMTGGGPGYSTMTIVNYLYKKGFEEYNMGSASAVAYVLFVMLLLLTMIQNKISKSE